MENNIKYDIFNTKDNSSNATIFLDQQLLENDRFSKKKQLERDSNINSTLIETYDKEKENKNYIYIPYENKEEAKLNGAIWDMNFKLWYVSDINNLLYEKYKKRFLKNSYDLKDHYKLHNGKWDKLRSSWYTYNGNDKLKEHFQTNFIK